MEIKVYLYLLPGIRKTQKQLHPHSFLICSLTHNTLTELQKNRDLYQTFHGQMQAEACFAQF